YTLLDIPDFDENGIWFHRGIGFSAKGTLKDTVAELVSASDAGRTHSELEGLVRARVHNALLALTREERVGREHLGRMYLYVNADPGVASEQVRRRQEWLESRSEAEIPLSDTLTIEVLVEALHMSEARVAPEDVAERLRARGVSIRPEQVREVFARYGMDPEKKTAPPSKPSPR
ncbi:MAG: hypothetical protein PSX37_09830, partial [bacterium]|nr:hypothetical protein [bacterium]